MEEKANEQKLVSALLEELKKDRAKTQVLQISEFGLIELTRQRVKQSLERTMLQSCPYCDGRGQVKSVDTVCYEILREVKRLRGELNGREVVIRANPVITQALRADEQTIFNQMKAEIEGPLTLVGDGHFHQEQYEVVNL